ncbi:MAG: hypothetical protein E5W55_28115, partial [Mesorhizobium sp.]
FHAEAGRNVLPLRLCLSAAIVVEASINPPGGYVTLRAEQYLQLVVTACSVDHHPTNGGVCTEIDVEIVPGP